MLVQDFPLADVGALDLPLPPPPPPDGDGFSEVSDWTVVSSADFVSSSTGEACAAELVFGEVTIINLDASLSLRVCTRACLSDASTANVVIVGPNASMTLPTYGLRSRRLSFNGAAAASIVVQLAPY